MASAATLFQQLLDKLCCTDRQNASESAKTVEQMPVWSHGAHGWKMLEVQKATDGSPSPDESIQTLPVAARQDSDDSQRYWQPKVPTAPDKPQPKLEGPEETTWGGACCCAPSFRYTGPNFMPDTYFMAIDRTNGASVGLAFDVLDETRCVIAQVKPHGLVADWNKTATPSQVVQAGDFIQEVNGIPGNGREIASKLLDWTSKMRLKIKRPRTISVKFAKKGKVLGVSMGAHDRAKANDDAGTDVLLITAVNPNGALQAWNDDPANTAKVSAGDRIISVNGVTKQQPMQDRKSVV